MVDYGRVPNWKKIKRKKKKIQHTNYQVNNLFQEKLGNVIDYVYN